jgi:hypothetical protein
MMKVILSFAVLCLAAKVNSQFPMQLPVMNFDMAQFMAHQQQAQHQMPPHEHMRQHPEMHQAQPEIHQHQAHEQMVGNPHEHQHDHQHEAEPMVGSPLIGLGLNPFHPLHPLAKMALPIPGARFSNLNMGKFGNMHYANSILGSGNPMEADEHQLAAPEPQGYQMEQQQYQAEPQHYQLAAPMPQQPQHYQLAAPMQHYQAEPQHYQLAAPMQQYQAEPQHPQHYQLAAPMMPPMQPMGPPMPQPIPVQPMHMQPEDGARHFWKKGGDDYGYG